MPDQLTGRQRRILEVIRDAVDEHGYPPSIREIGDAVGLTSTSSVHSQLKALQRKGYIRRDPTKPRAIEVHVDEPAVAQPRPLPAYVPLLGQIAAGAPILADEQVEELLPMPRDVVGNGELFMLRVRGDSMIEAGILDGDYVVAPRADGGERRNCRGVARRRGDREDALASWRTGPAAAREPGLRADRRIRRAHPRQGGHRSAPPLSQAARATSRTQRTRDKVCAWTPHLRPTNTRARSKPRTTPSSRPSMPTEPTRSRASPTAVTGASPKCCHISAAARRSAPNGCAPLSPARTRRRTSRRRSGRAGTPTRPSSRPPSSAPPTPRRSPRSRLSTMRRSRTPRSTSGRCVCRSRSCRPCASTSTRCIPGTSA